MAATAIEQDEYRLDGTVSGPITDVLSYRLTGAWVDDGGYAKNVFNGDKVNTRESLDLRGKLLWQATDDLELLFAADYGKRDCDCTALGVRDIRESAQQEALLAEQLPVVPSKDNQDVNNDQPTEAEERSNGFALTLNWNVNDFLITSITSFRDWTHEGNVDLDNRPVNPFALTSPENPETEQDQFSQEIRLSSSPEDWGSYIVGLYYFDQERDTSSATRTAYLEPIFEPATRYAATNVRSKNSAVFGEVNINFGESWLLTLGGRYTYDDLSYDTLVEGTHPIIFPNEGEASDSLTESDFSPKVALQWDVSDYAMLYASYVSGYKGPAFDTSLVADGSFVEPETSDAFELGLKSSWLDNRLVLNLTLFHADYEDFQADALVDLDPDDALPPAFVLVNAAEVSTQGVELEMISKPTDNWTLSAGIAYTDATIEDYPTGNCSAAQKFRGECPLGFQDLSGGQLPYTPEWKLTLATDYRIALQSAPFDVILGGNLRTQDDVLFELSQEKYSWQDAYTIVDVFGTLAGRERGYRLTAFVKNLLDENYVNLIFAHGTELLPHGYLHSVPKYAERTAGVEFQYDF